MRIKAANARISMKPLMILVLGISIIPLHAYCQDAPDFKVEYAGALKNMMHKGDISAKAALKDIKKVKHLYALGAIEDLKGEIQIFDSHPSLTMVKEGAIAFDKSYKQKAALLVYASVSKWRTVSIPASVVTYAKLEAFIGQAADEAGIDISAPFPFLLEGKVRSFDWHVINWKDGDMEHSHEKHIKSGLHGTIEDREVEMLGFYSNAHHAIFTHHTTNMHIHVRSVDGEMAGHVDGLTLGGDMVLKLPR